MCLRQERTSRGREGPRAAGHPPAEHNQWPLARPPGIGRAGTEAAQVRARNAGVTANTPPDSGTNRVAGVGLARTPGWLAGRRAACESTSTATRAASGWSATSPRAHCEVVVVLAVGVVQVIFEVGTVVGAACLPARRREGLL